MQQYKMGKNIFTTLRLSSIGLSVVGLAIGTFNCPAAQPVRVGGFDPAAAAYFHVATRGDYVFVTDFGTTFGDEDLLSLDVRSPSAPTRCEAAPLPICQTAPQESANDGVAISGDYAFVVTTDKTTIIDIGLPSKPLTVANWLGSGNCVAAAGNYMYVAGSKLAIVDVSQPTAPLKTGELTLAGTPHSIRVSGNRAYIANQAGLLVVDISNPSDPRLLGQCATYASQGLAVLGSRAYIADGAYGLRVVDVSNPAAPLIVGTYRSSGYVSSVALSSDGHYAVVTEWVSSSASARLIVLDVSTPASITVFGSVALTSSWSFMPVAVQGDYAYVAEHDSGLEVLKLNLPITVPNPPQLVQHMFSGLSVTGTIGATYRIEATASLSNPAWNTVGTMTLTNTTQYWIDSRSPATGKCFYRAVVP